MNQIYQLGFELGKDVPLSVAELLAVFSLLKIDVSYRLVNKNLFLVESENPSLMDISIDTLGGTVKIFKVLGSVNKSNDLANFITQNFTPVQEEKRVNFGLSGYGEINKKVLYLVGQELKTAFVQKGLKARLVTSKVNILSSVIVKENKLIDRGFEALIIKDNHSLLVGQTISVQNYKLYSKRDYGRPVRDDRNGMLPPKLAQIMINLACLSKDMVIYDPFCGSGTVLQEALLLGFNDLYGSDISEKQVSDSLVNLKWLEQNFDTKKLPPEKLFVSDILSPEEKILADAIITEGYLGLPYQKNKNTALDEIRKLADFYLKALANMVRCLQDNGQIIFALPFFVVDNEYFYLPILDKLTDLGLDLIRPIPVDSGIRPVGRGNLTYRRENQFVGREILVLKKRP